MSTLFSDDFTRADSGDLGSNWENADMNWDIQSNKAEAQTSSGNVIRTAAAAHADTADIRVSVKQNATGGDGGPVCRCTAGGGSPTCYAADCYSNTLDLYRHNASTSGTLLATGSITQVANGKIGVEARGTGGTVTVRRWYQDVQQGSDYSDTSGSRLTAGRSGMQNYTTSTEADATYDDFLVEDFAAAASHPHRFGLLGVGM